MRRQEAIDLGTTTGKAYVDNLARPPELLQPLGYPGQIQPHTPQQIAAAKAAVEQWRSDVKAAAKAEFEARAAANTDIAAFGHTAAFIEAAQAAFIPSIETMARLTVSASMK